MKFTEDDMNQVCLMSDGSSVGMIIQINSQIEPFDVAVQIPGDPESRIMGWDRFKRVGGVIAEKHGDEIVNNFRSEWLGQKLVVSPEESFFLGEIIEETDESVRVAVWRPKASFLPNKEGGK